VFELDRGQHHDHMVDVDTGKVIEFVSEEIERLQHAIAEKHGYLIEDHSLVLYVRKKGAAGGRREPGYAARRCAARTGRSGR
jgi:Fur family ferric uptake transcriptional regulator